MYIYFNNSRSLWVRRLVCAFLFVMCAGNVCAGNVKVRLFSSVTINVLNVSFDLGSYTLYVDDGRMIDSAMSQGRQVELKAVGNQVNISVDGYNYAFHKSARLVACDSACILCLNPANAKQRTYEGGLLVTNKGGHLLIINDVGFETYLAGVVQSEIYGKESDIYRVQSIISRTWALRNIHKHEADGYNFCDDVHCQAYHNRCIRPEIMLGVVAGTGQTIVDSAGNLIETPFHSNSGGQTANSEDVWRNAVPYLRSVPDSISLTMKQGSWQKIFSEDKWLNYFKKYHSLNIADAAVRDSLLHFAQPSRKAKIMGVPLTRVRVDFSLKSTFFTVEYDSLQHRVVLHGHGYGHGVGLSQEGTIAMVRQGISYDSIIKHYYKGAVILSPDAGVQDYVSHYVSQIQQIIEEDKHTATQKKSKKEDWLGRLFRIRDREEREEVFDPKKQELESDWKYEW